MSNTDDFQRIADALKPGQWVSFYVRRGGQMFYRALKVPAGQQ